MVNYIWLEFMTAKSSLTLKDHRRSSLWTFSIVWRVKHAVVYTVWAVMMAGVWFLAGRFPCIFLTLGSFPCWHSPAAHRSPLWDDSCLTQTGSGHALVEKTFRHRVYFYGVVCAFFPLCKVLWDNMQRGLWCSVMNACKELIDYIFLLF